MKKGIIATAFLALAIGIMTVLLSMQFCHWIPSWKAVCWVQEQVHSPQEMMMVHHGQMNTWHERMEGGHHDLSMLLKERPGFGTLPNGMQECEMGKEAAYALGNGDASRAIPSLETIAIHAHCLEVRKAAVHAIEGFGSEEARAALIRILLATAE